MGATDTFLSKVSGLAPTLNSGYMLSAAILLQIPANYTYAAVFKMHQAPAVARICTVANRHCLCRRHQRWCDILRQANHANHFNLISAWTGEGAVSCVRGEC
jgi:hypothetical protein